MLTSAAPVSMGLECKNEEEHLACISVFDSVARQERDRHHPISSRAFNSKKTVLVFLDLKILLCFLALSWTPLYTYPH